MAPYKYFHTYICMYITFQIGFYHQFHVKIHTIVHNIIVTSSCIIITFSIPKISVLVGCTCLGCALRLSSSRVSAVVVVDRGSPDCACVRHAARAAPPAPAGLVSL